MPVNLARRAGRHLLTAILALALVYLFLSLRPGSGVHAWNRSFADAAFVFLVLTMVLGPLARVAPRLRRGLTWRHEFGVWTIILAIAHVYIILDGWVHWDLTGFYLIPEEREAGVSVVNRPFLMGNLVGAIALVYGLLLLATSNRWAQRRLGKSWTYVQAGSRAYVLLVVIHSAYFLFWHYSVYPQAEPGLFTTPFLLLTILLYVLIVVGFFATLGRNKRRVQGALNRRGLPPPPAPP